jgi:hypothetical protein
MPAPSEPEKYSIDDMMERLKSPPSENVIEDGELVIRADGSQAIRVRKRKRRSQQPHKEAQKQSRQRRMIQVAAVLILVFVALFGAGTALIWANSTPFREKLQREIARDSRANVEMTQFRMNPNSANAAQLSFSWPEGNALQSLTFGNIKADISPSSFFGSSLAGDEVTCAEGILILRSPLPNQPSWIIPSSDISKPIHFNRYASARTQVRLGNASSPLLLLRNSSASFYPSHASGRPQLLLDSGELTLNGYPKLRMDRAHLEFRGTEIDVVSLRLRHETDNQGVFELTGTLSPYAADSSPRLDIRLESFLLAGLVGPELGRLFSGRIDSRPDPKSNYLSFKSTPNPNALLSVAFSNSLATAFEIKEFPFLFGLSQTLGDDWFERPVFENDVSGTVRRENGTVCISDLRCEAKSRMALRGTLTLTPDRKLSGNFNIGVTDAMILSAKSHHLDALFGPPTDGFRWLSLKIGGSAAVPSDNFKELFLTTSLAPAPTAPPPSNKIPSFEDLTNPK